MTMLGDPADKRKRPPSLSRQVPAGSNPARPQYLPTYFFFFARNEIPERIAFC